MTFVDGAHAPGHILLDLQTLNADFYTGACHKWMMTPKGSSFLYVRKELQSTVDPLIISWGYNAMFPSDSQFIDYHQMNGSRDLSAFLSIPAAINFMQEHDWKTVAASCRNLVQENIEPFCKLLGASPLSPLNDDFNLQLFQCRNKNYRT